MTQKSASTYNLPSHMVSHSQQPDNAPTARRPASVTSRSTTARRHRASRSHSGGTSYRLQNEFPNFAQTGDVEIIINAEGQEKRYMLHRLILAQCSGFFEAGTSEDWSRAQAEGATYTAGPSHGNGLAKIGEEDEYGGKTGRPALAVTSHDRHRWRYELDWGNKDDEVPMLVQKVIASSVLRAPFLTCLTAHSLNPLWRRPYLPSSSRPHKTSSTNEFLLPFLHRHAICRQHTPPSS